MRFSGLNTQRRNIRPDESPDSRNGLIDYTGTLRTRPGVARQNDTAMGQINKLIYLKSDDCENDYNFAWTANGSLIVNPEDYPALPQLANLQGYWKFEEASGLFLDSSTQGNSGTYNGVLYQQPGKVGYGLGFDGADDYVTVGNQAVHNFGSGDFTLSAWFKTTVAAYRIILSKYPTGGGEGYEIYAGNSGFAGMYIADTGGVNTATADDITDTADGELHYLAGVRDGNTLRLYVDGVAVDTGDASAVGSVSNTGALLFGDWQNLGDYPFDGTIDEIAIWNKALTAAEILEYYSWTK